jgi:hypothetical protein
MSLCSSFTSSSSSYHPFSSPLGEKIKICPSGEKDGKKGEEDEEEEQEDEV